MEIEVKIRALMMDPNSGTPIIILKDVNSETMLPIWVGATKRTRLLWRLRKLRRRGQ
jgi:bifunctional DNase/RNase